MSTLGMLHLDPSGKIVECNDRATELLDLSYEQLVSLTLVEATRIETLRKIVQRAVHGENGVFEGEYVSTSGGQTTLLHVICSPITPEETPSNVIASLEDITGRRQPKQEHDEYSDHLEELLQQRTAELIEVTTALHREQQQFARTLHDSVSQTLFSAHTLAKLLPRVIEDNPDRAKEISLEVSRAVRGAMAEMRSLLIELRPETIAQTELGFLIRQLADAFAGQTRIPTETIIAERVVLPAMDQIAFYRIAQEALGISAKYSNATQLKITLERDGSSVTLAVHDNGIGVNDKSFVVATCPGIRMMTKQAEQIGASLTIVHQERHGLQIRLCGDYRD